MADFTIADIAEQLGVSKSTVSRVINGKGRISNETRDRIQKWIDDHGYSPNPMAKALAQNRTNNIAVVIPKDADNVDIPFFQNCLIGIAETASQNRYDTVLAIEDNYDISILERLVCNKKVDGVILTRLDDNDESVKFLVKEQFPFVGIGSLNDDKICQVDSDTVAGCYDITERMLQSGYTHMVLLAGNENHLVSKKRYQGYIKAFEDAGIPVDNLTVEWNMHRSESVMSKLPKIMACNPQCLVCMDDVICSAVLMWLSLNGYKVPDNVQVISLYDSPVMEHHVPSITALSVDVAMLSSIAAKTLIDKLDGKKISTINHVGYEIKVRKSSR